MAKSDRWRNCLLTLLLTAVLLLSIFSIKGFPDPFDDEGLYAAMGKNYVAVGVFNSPSLMNTPTWIKGDVASSRINSILFGVAGRTFGDTLLTARSVSFIAVLLATVFWFFIARVLGIPGMAGALLFASSERIFYSSHVFRPEAIQVLVNTFFIWFLCRFAQKPCSRSAVFFRGLMNAPFVLAHGNGLVTALLNTFELLLRRFKKIKDFFSTGLLYLLGSCLAVGIFYFVQMHGEGGWSAFFVQMKESPQVWKSNGFFDLIKYDITARWGRELVYVGGSTFAKVLRFYYYGVMLVASIYAAIKLPGLSRRLGLLSIGSFLGYMFVVKDKPDIYISEMIPFYMAALLATCAALKKQSATLIANTAMGTILALNLVLCGHHALKYNSTSPTEIADRKILDFIQSEKIRPARDYKTIVGPMQHWFLLHHSALFLSMRFANQHLPIHGGVIVIPEKREAFLKDCRLEYQDSGYFAAFFCP